MTIPNEPKKRVPLGPDVPWTEEEMEQMSIVTPEDIERAKALVRKASPKLSRLLDSKEVDDGSSDGATESNPGNP